MSQPNNSLTIIKRIPWALLVLAVHIFYFLQNKSTSKAVDLTTIVDTKIHFSSIFIIPYESWYFCIAGVLILFAILCAKIYYQCLVSMVSGALICNLTFYFFPTVISRPIIQGNSILDSMVKALYKVDNPYNCFPSIHVLYIVIATLFICTYFKNKFIWFLFITWCFLITISTMFIKQHFFLDTVSAIFLALVLYLFFTNEHIWGKLQPTKRLTLPK